MSDYSEMYLNRLKQRFAALAATPAWENIKTLCYNLADTDSNEGITALSAICVRLSQQQNLPFGPRRCSECNEALVGDFGPEDSCPACIARFEEQRRVAEQREYERKRRWSRLTPEEQAEEIRSTLGLIKRDVQ